jgi:hypothetical protein
MVHREVRRSGRSGDHGDQSHRNRLAGSKHAITVREFTVIAASLWVKLRETVPVNSRSL